MDPRTEARAVFLVLAFAGVLFGVLFKKGERIRAAALLAAWAVPGAGHVLLGRWRKGLFFFLILAATYVAGMWIVGFRPVSFDDNPFYYVGQYGSGATYLLAKVISTEKAILRPDRDPSWFDPGLLYVCVVGLLNLVVILNVIDLKPAAWAARAAEPALSLPTGPAPSTGSGQALSTGSGQAAEGKGVSGPGTPSPERPA